MYGNLKWVEEPYVLIFQTGRFHPDAVRARHLLGVLDSVCVDPECDLSFGEAHVGPCEPCSCPMRHAVAECPENGVLAKTLEDAQIRSTEQALLKAAP